MVHFRVLKAIHLKRERGESPSDSSGQDRVAAWTSSAQSAHKTKLLVCRRKKLNTKNQGPKKKSKRAKALSCTFGGPEASFSARHHRAPSKASARSPAENLRSERALRGF